MYPPVQRNSALGIVCIIAGTILFILAAGEFLLKLIIALGGLWLIAFGTQLHTGRSVNIMFWKNR